MREGQAVEQALWQEHELSQAAFASISDGLVSTTASGRINFCNAAACTLLRQPASTLLGQSLSMVFHLEPDPAGGQVGGLAGMRLMAQQGERIFEHTVIALLGPGGQRNGELILFRDVTGEHEMRQRLQHEARHDPLTGLANRHRLADYAAAWLPRVQVEGGLLALLVIDPGLHAGGVEHLGMTGSDRVLVEIARRLRSHVKEPALLCRAGGEEFILVLPRPNNRPEIEYLAEFLLLSLREPLAIDETLLQLRPAIGIALYPQHGTTLDELLQRADQALLSLRRIDGGGACFSPE